jgi:hypothetical protein
MGSSESKTKGAKSSKGKPDGQQAATTGHSFGSTPISTLLGNDDSRKQLKVWAKTQNNNCLWSIEAWEAINKRKNVYKSGKQCGDDEETLADRIEALGQDIIDKFIRSESEKALDLSSTAEGFGSDSLPLSKLDTFNQLADAIEKYLDKALGR